MLLLFGAYLDQKQKKGTSGTSEAPTKPITIQRKVIQEESGAGNSAASRTVQLSEILAAPEIVEMNQESARLENFEIEDDEEGVS